MAAGETLAPAAAPSLASAAALAVATFPDAVVTVQYSPKDWAHVKFDGFLALLRHKVAGRAVIVFEDAVLGVFTVSIGKEILLEKLSRRGFSGIQRTGGEIGAVGLPTAEELDGVSQLLGERLGIDLTWTDEEFALLQTMHDANMADAAQRALFIVDDRVYDLAKFIPIHPGGNRFFKGPFVDLTCEVAIYHDRPELVRKRLAQYEAHDVSRFDVPWVLAPPPFISPSPDCGWWFVSCPRRSQPERRRMKTALKRQPLRGRPPPPLPAPFYLDSSDKETSAHIYDWNDPAHLVPTLRRRISQDSKLAKRMKRANALFDVISFIFLAVHVLLIFPVAGYRLVSSIIVVPLLVCTRVALSACGHYHCHRSKNGLTDWGECLFDMTYVGQCLITYVGHVRGHHIGRFSFPDPKAQVFTGMLEIPRFWRVPTYLAYKFGHLFTGTFVRFYGFIGQDSDAGFRHMKIHELTKWRWLKVVQFFSVRILLLLELFWCIWRGRATMWVVQFSVTTFWSLFLIVSSHEFESPPLIIPKNRDWGVFQVMNTLDVFVTGIKHIDTWLTGGLSCHRVHHLLPNHGSGFSNILVEPIVKQVVSEQFHISWIEEESFLTSRVPHLASLYFFAPARPPRIFGRPPYGGTSGSVLARLYREHVNPEALLATVRFICLGFVGDGI
eukprot:NODE_1791_length_2372_cov_16.928731.p1 GENE.NODE_1791_length_2372_cov_16.928731~~NODE_1791_length_2372_cov_16.928731.p1  ORF type:complete len:668 (+),score=117.57 NODE_1791_length_2372_cov_16.928731:75-2078(+)